MEYDIRVKYHFESMVQVFIDLLYYSYLRLRVAIWFMESRKKIKAIVVVSKR